MGAIKIEDKEPQVQFVAESIKPLGIFDPRNPHAARNAKLSKLYNNKSSLFFSLVGISAPLTYLLFYYNVPAIFIGFISFTLLIFAMRVRLQLVRINAAIKEKTVQLSLGDRLLLSRRGRLEYFQVVAFGFNHYYLARLSEPLENKLATTPIEKEKTLLLQKRRVHNEFRLLKEVS